METPSTVANAPIDPLQVLREKREMLKAENDAIEAELLRAEELKSKAVLAGRSTINPAPQKSQEQINKENAAEFWKGTAIEKAIQKHG